MASIIAFAVNLRCSIPKPSSIQEPDGPAFTLKLNQTLSPELTAVRAWFERKLLAGGVAPTSDTSLKTVQPPPECGIALIRPRWILKKGVKNKRAVLKIALFIASPFPLQNERVSGSIFRTAQKTVQVSKNSLLKSDESITSSFVPVKATTPFSVSNIISSASFSVSRWSWVTYTSVMLRCCFRSRI